jgi:branched-chain amino acid transport system ATP-binding protein
MEALRVDSITVNFGKLTALSNVSLAVPAGERRGLIGPNGAGKTTLFNVVSGYLRPTSGEIHIFGKKVTGIAPYKFVGMGLVRTFQRINIFLNLSVLDNLLLSLEEKALNWRSFKLGRTDVREKAEGILEEFGLIEKIHLPARSLSYGEQRCLEIALALSLEPKIILLDEPTAGLSSFETQKIGEIIHNLPKEITTVIIEHDMDVIFDLTDWITVLHHGSIIAEGTGDEIKANKDVREIYLGKKRVK